MTIVDDMPAGRELDALVAEKVMGCEVLSRKFCCVYVEGESSIHTDRDNADGWACDAEMEQVRVLHCCCDYDWSANGDPEKYRRWIDQDAADKAQFGHTRNCLDVIPEYSTSIAAAWEVMEKVSFRTEATKGKFSAERYGWNGPKQWRCGWINGGKWATENVTAQADTAALAICRAALKAVDARQTA